LDVTRGAVVQALHALAQDSAVDLVDHGLGAEAFSREKTRLLVVHVLLEALKETNERARDFADTRINARHDGAKDRALFGMITMQKLDANWTPGVVALQERNNDVLFEIEVPLEFGSELSKHVLQHGELRLVRFARACHADECTAEAPQDSMIGRDASPNFLF
jgi:hypothetical protein